MGKMFPAHAGMNRRQSASWGRAAYVPRPRGGEPESGVFCEVQDADDPLPGGGESRFSLISREDPSAPPTRQFGSNARFQRVGDFKRVRNPCSLFTTIVDICFRRFIPRFAELPSDLVYGLN